MSNRPVPRVKPAEVAAVQEAIEAAAEPPVPSSRLTELMSAFETSQAVVNGLRHTVLEHRAQRIFDDIAALRAAAPQKKPSTSPSSSSPAEKFKWRPVPITELAVKFAVSDFSLLSCSTEILTDGPTALQAYLPAHALPHLGPVPLLLQDPRRPLPTPL
jgi:hypothetical protein